MASNAFALTVTIERASEESGIWSEVPSIGTSESTVDWHEYRSFIPESPSGLSAACGDDFFDDPVYLDNSSGLQTPISPDAFTFAPFFPSLDCELQSEGTSTSTALPSYESYSLARGRRSFPLSPEISTVRSRSTPRSLLPVSPTQLRRFASMESLTSKGPCHLPDAHHTPVFDTRDFLPFSLGDSELDPFLSPDSCWLMYDNHFDHDLQASSPTRLSPSHTGDCNSRDTGATSIASLSLLGRHGARNQSVSQQENNFLTGGACGLRRSVAYPDDGQSSIGAMLPQKPLGVSTYPAGSIIDPGPITGSGVEVDESSLLATGDRAAPTLDRNDRQPSTPSGRARKFRPLVGSRAMAEACMKRRKKRMDGLSRLFVCEVPGCGRDFTARHNLKYHMKSHNDIRDEICDDCGTGFVTRETLHRHQKSCKKPNHYM